MNHLAATSVLLSLVVALSQSADARPADCSQSGASGPHRDPVCSSQELKDLDVQMSAAFDVVAKGPYGAPVRELQRIWLKERTDSLKPVELYQQQVQLLREWAEPKNVPADKELARYGVYGVKVDYCRYGDRPRPKDLPEDDGDCEEVWDRVALLPLPAGKVRLVANTHGSRSPNFCFIEATGQWTAPDTLQAEVDSGEDNAPYRLRVVLGKSGLSAQLLFNGERAKLPLFVCSHDTDFEVQSFSKVYPAKVYGRQ